MKISRKDFVSKLTSVYIGVADKAGEIQSDCFIFQHGKVMSYNSGVACQTESGLPAELIVVVKAKSLFDTLAKFTEDEISVKIENDKLYVYGQGKKITNCIEKEVLISIDSIEKPTDWKPLPKDFSEAIAIVSPCAGKNKANFNFTCLHFTPTHIEAADVTQLCRYKIDIGLRDEFLIKKDCLSEIPNLGVTDFSYTDNWLHFKNPTGLICSCRRILQPYPQLDKYLGNKGVSLTLPDGLLEVVNRAKISAAENKDDDKLQIDLRKGKFKVTGRGISTKYEEVKEIVYDGPDISFRISPKMLLGIARRSNHVEVTKDQLNISGDRWTFVACLYKVRDQESE